MRPQAYVTVVKLFLRLVIAIAVIPGVGEAQTTTLVSVSSAGELAGGGSPALSADGRYVAFQSTSSNLVPEDTNRASDIFVRDRQTGVTTRVSVLSDGGQANGPSSSPVLSADGRFVAFQSDASNLIEGNSAGISDINRLNDVFVHDRQTGATTIVSWRASCGGGNGCGNSPAISADGRFVAFQSGAPNPNLPFSNPGGDIFVRDGTNHFGRMTLVSVSSTGEPGNGPSRQASISADGRFVTFQSDSTNLTSEGFGGGVYVHDRQTGVTTLVSVSSAGQPARGTSPSISGDGRYVAFISNDSDLDLVHEDSGGNDVFVHDRQTGTTTLASMSSTGVGGHGFGTSNPSISADGRFVAFESNSDNLVPGNTDLLKPDVFLHDRQTGATTRVSVSSAGVEGNNGSSNPVLSADGRIVAFESGAFNLVPGFSGFIGAQVYVHDRGAMAVSSPTGADLNGDGRADIVWRNTSSGIVSIWLMNGLKVASSGSLVGLSAEWRLAGIGDVNEDGKADVIWHNTSTGEVAVWLMNGLTNTSVGFPARVSTDWEIADVGDMDGNGTTDILWRNTSSGVVAVWLMDGGIIASAGFPAGVPAEWQIEGIGDVNGDGKGDVVWQHTITGTVAVWFMNGLSITSVGFPASVSTEWDLKGFGDVDGNGTADVVWRNTSSGVVAVWLMNGATIGSSGILPGKSADWAIAQVGDTSGDGKADLIWLNSNKELLRTRTCDKCVEAWLMNGLTIITTGSPGGNLGTDWEIQ